MRVTVSVTLDVDPAAWDANYGTGTAHADVTADVRQYVRQSTVEWFREQRLLADGSNDALLTVREVADLLGWKTGTVRAARANGYLPTPDEPDLDTPANLRRPRWRESTIQAFAVARARKAVEAG